MLYQLFLESPVFSDGHDGITEYLLPKLYKSLNMEDFRDFCFVLEIDVDDLAGTTKRAKIRELLLRAERRGRLPEIVKAYEELSEQES